MDTVNRAELTPVLLVGVLSLLCIGSCSRPDLTAPRRRLPGIDAPKPERPKSPSDEEEARAARKPFVDPLEELWVKLDNEVRMQVAESASVGCLPFVSYDLKHEGGWVSQLGVRVADELATRLRRRRVRALGSSEMALLIRDVNATKASLSDTARVLENGDRLGVEAIVYGITNLRDRSRFEGAGAPRILEVKGTAVDIVGGRVLAEHTVKISNRYPQNAEYWRWAQTESDWQPDGDWGPKEPEPTFDREIAVACRVLARRIMPQLEDRGSGSTVYIPPTDTATFVRSIARLRMAQRTYASEVARRTQESDNPGTSSERTTGMTLDGVEFANLQAAESYLNALRESLFLESEGGRFARGLSKSFSDALLAMPSRNGTDFRVNDVGSTPQSNSVHLVEGELPTGGLVDNLSARDALRSQGIQTVVAPRIERYASHFVIRVDIYDLEGGIVLGGSHFRIEDRFGREMRIALGVHDYALEKIKDVKTTVNNAWSEVFDRVNSGVVRLEGNGGFGTGFVVSKQGHIMTNAHVINNLGATPTVLARDGNRSSFDVVLNDGFWDIAVVKIPELPQYTHVFDFATADRARVGAEVAVLGHPKHTQGWVFTKGNVSSISEQVSTAGGVRPSYMYTNPTRGGSSGSPVLLLDGTILCVHSAGQVGFLAGGIQKSELVGFALGVPGSEAQKLLESVIR